MIGIIFHPGLGRVARRLRRRNNIIMWIRKHSETLLHRLLSTAHAFHVRSLGSDDRAEQLAGHSRFSRRRKHAYCRLSRNLRQECVPDRFPMLEGSGLPGLRLVLASGGRGIPTPSFEPPMKGSTMDHLRTNVIPQCPSSQPEIKGAAVFAIIQGTPNEPRVGYLDRLVPLSTPKSRR